jgi:hypothetical protein
MTSGVSLRGSLGRMPAHLEWSHYARKEAQRNDRCTGSFDSYVTYIQTIGQRLAPEGGKAEAPYLSSVTRGDGKSNDANCEAIYALVFDCDEAGTWERLKTWCEAQEVTALFQQSNSRRADRWHVSFPLAEPIRLDGSKEAIARYKHAYKHAAAVLSVAAGFDGVGGHCGFDLMTDRCVQPMFVPMLREPGDSPAELAVTEGYALDWELFLRSTSFNLEESALAGARAGGRTNKNGTRRTATSSKFGGGSGGPASSAEWGPFGQALMLDGMIGQQKDDVGYHALCTHPERHTSGKAEGYAIYYPGNDTLWCASSGCASAEVPTHKDRAGQLGRLSDRARGTYLRLTNAKFAAERANGAPTSWADLAGDHKPLKDWAEAQNEMFPKIKVTQAMIGALLVAGWGPDMIRRAARSILGDAEGDQEAIKILQDARRRGGRVAQQGRLRELLSPRQLHEITEVLYLLSQAGRDKIARWGSRGTIRDNKAAWLLDLAARVPIHEPDLKNTLVRPAGCCRYFDQIIADGENQGRRTLVCESTACAECWVKRVETEAAILIATWDDKIVYGIVKVTLPDEESLERFSEKVVRRIKNSPRIKLHGRDEKGQPTLTFVGTRVSLAQTRGDLIAECAPGRAGAFAPGKADRVKFEATLTATKTEAIQAVVDARLSLHWHHGGAIHDQDRERLTNWIEWLRPRRKTGKRGSRHLVTRGPTALPFPNREAIRDFHRKGDPPVDLSECWSVKFELHDAKHEWLLHSSEQRHSLPAAMEIAKYHREFQAVKEVLDAPRDREQERLDAAYARSLHASHTQAPRYALRL